MWEKILMYLLNAIVAPFIMAFLKNFAAARQDNEGLLTFIEQQVRREMESDRQHGARFEQVKRDVIAYCLEIGLDVKDSFINTAIELAVQKVKQDV